MAEPPQPRTLSAMKRLFGICCVLATSAIIFFMSLDSHHFRTKSRSDDYGVDLLLARDYPIWRGQPRRTKVADWNPDNATKPLCPLHNADLGIKVPVDVKKVTYDDVRSLYYPMVQRGGYYPPSECRSHNKTAIVIPYRDREKNLMILLRNLIPFLVLQNAEFRLFVVEQTKDGLFNKGVLINIGYLEAKKLYGFNCFMFHDTDWLPVDFRNTYTCSRHPKHLLVTRPELRHYGPMYHTAFGGAVTFTRTMFEAVNGFSNLYYGWGKEDDDLRRRYTLKEIPVERNDWVIGTYVSTDHKKQKRSNKRHSVYKQALAHPELDGLNSVNNSVVSVHIQEKELYTHILVELRHTSATGSAGVRLWIGFQCLYLFVSITLVT